MLDIVMSSYGAGGCVRHLDGGKFIDNVGG